MMDGELTASSTASLASPLVKASRRCTASAWRSAGARLAPSLPGPAAPVEEKEDPFVMYGTGLYIGRG